MPPGKNKALPSGIFQSAVSVVFKGFPCEEAFFMCIILSNYILKKAFTNYPENSLAGGKRCLPSSGCSSLFFGF
jgi:hypothetical protein